MGGRRRGFVLSVVLSASSFVWLLAVQLFSGDRRTLREAVVRSDYLVARFAMEGCAALLAEGLSERRRLGRAQWSDQQLSSLQLPGAEHPCGVALTPAGLRADVNALDADQLSRAAAVLGMPPHLQDGAAEAVIRWRTDRGAKRLATLSMLAVIDSGWRLVQPSILLSVDPAPLWIGLVSDSVLSVFLRGPVPQAMQLAERARCFPTDGGTLAAFAPQSSRCSALRVELARHTELAFREVPDELDARISYGGLPFGLNARLSAVGDEWRVTRLWSPLW